jgi:hypothetical protein
MFYLWCISELPPLRFMRCPIFYVFIDPLSLREKSQWSIHFSIILKFKKNNDGIRWNTLREKQNTTNLIYYILTQFTANSTQFTFKNEMGVRIYKKTIPLLSFLYVNFIGYEFRDYTESSIKMLLFFKNLWFFFIFQHFIY